MQFLLTTVIQQKFLLLVFNCKSYFCCRQRSRLSPIYEMDCDFGFESIQKAMDYGENLNGSEKEMYQKLLVLFFLFKQCLLSIVLFFRQWDLISEISASWYNLTWLLFLLCFRCFRTFSQTESFKMIFFSCYRVLVILKVCIT